jgi:hypothetical protein
MDTRVSVALPLDSIPPTPENGVMVIPGRVENGVVIPESASVLPEGAAVTITYPALTTNRESTPRQRIQVPLVRTGQPGSVRLTGETIAEILDHEDASARR